MSCPARYLSGRSTHCLEDCLYLWVNFIARAMAMVDETPQERTLPNMFVCRSGLVGFLFCVVRHLNSTAPFVLNISKLESLGGAVY